MNVIKIFNRIKLIGKDYEGSYSKGFFDCLMLFKVAFKQEPSINLHLENAKLNKRIHELEKELDDKDYDLITIKDQNKFLLEKICRLEGGKITVSNCKTIVLRKNLIVQTGAPQEKVEQLYNECLQESKLNISLKRSRRLLFQSLQERLKEEGYEIARSN